MYVRDSFLPSSLALSAKTGGANLCNIGSAQVKESRRDLSLMVQSSLLKQPGELDLTIMTVLFPRRYEGLHPAFVPLDSRTTLSSIAAAPPIAGCIGGLSFCLILIAKTIITSPLDFRRSFRPAAALSTKVAAYSLVGLGAVVGLSEYSADPAACAFLESKGIVNPHQQILSRPGSFECDDASVSGLLGSAAIATALRRPRMVTGWKRWIGAGSFGSVVSTVTYIFWYTGGDIGALQEIEAHTKARVEQRRRYSAEINQAWATRREGVKPTSLLLPPIERPRLPSTTGLFLGHLVPGHQQTGEITFDDRGGPHITARGKDNLESSPIPATNYKWTADPERTIPELEHHVEALKRQRQALAQESQLLWQWLAEKEGEYYRLCDEPVGLKAEEKKKMAAYIRVLGVQHTNLWLAVSRTDWMIADTQKRIEQHRAREQGGEDAVWMPETMHTAQAQRAGNALAALKRKREQVKQHLASLDEKKQAYIRELETGEPGLEHKLRPEVKSKMLTRPDWKDRIGELAEWHREDLQADREALDAVIRDVEIKSEQLGNESDRQDSDSNRP